MGITSRLFLITVGLIALAGCGLTLWLWPRLAGSGPRPVAGRIGLLFGTQIAVLVTVTALVNALFGFYTSWSDLFGAAPQRYQLRDAGTVQPGVNADQLRGGAGASPAIAQSPKPGRETALTTTLVGLRSGVTAQLEILLPPQYYDPKAARRYYPAIVVDGAPTLAHDVLSARQPPEAVIVIVHGDAQRPIPCVDQQDAAIAEQFWGQDLRTAITDAYRVRVSAAAWGVMADGPDNHCAAALAIEDAGRYSAAAVLGPWKAAGPPDSPADPAWWLHNYPPPPSRLLFAGLGVAPQTLLGPVRPPLQVTAQQGQIAPYDAVDWLARTLRHGAPTS